MEEKRKVIMTGIIVIAIIVIALVLYYFVFQKGKKAAPPEMVEKPPAQVSVEEPLEEKGREYTELAEVELEKSDALMRELSKDLSSHPKIEEWLKSKDLVRKFTAAIDNIANGMSPQSQVDFFSTDEGFKVIKRGGLYYLDPDNYHRYDAVADVFLSLDTESCLNIYRQSKPLIQEAYRDLGYPDQDFSKTLIRSIIELLKVPVVESEIRVEKKVVTYMMVDTRLERLSKAQKHLLRMGPENVRIIQEKLREMAKGLGYPEEGLPRPKTY